MAEQTAEAVDKVTDPHAEGDPQATQATEQGGQPETAQSATLIAGKWKNEEEVIRSDKEAQRKITELSAEALMLRTEAETLREVVKLRSQQAASTQESEKPQTWDDLQAGLTKKWRESDVPSDEIGKDLISLFKERDGYYNNIIRGLEEKLTKTTFELSPEYQAVREDVDALASTAPNVSKETLTAIVRMMRQREPVKATAPSSVIRPPVGSTGGSAGRGGGTESQGAVPKGMIDGLRAMGFSPEDVKAYVANKSKRG